VFIDKQVMNNSAARSEPQHEIDVLATSVIDAAEEVHRRLGPGFLEVVYEEALCAELTLRGIPFERQVQLEIHYKGALVGRSRIDLLIARCLVLELKSVEMVLPLHWTQALSYLKATELPLALVINFNVPLLRRGVRRVIRSLPQKI
jgi:GxxExxY protein